MGNENNKKGLFGLMSKTKKNNECCCNIEIEEISEEKEENINDSSIREGNNCGCVNKK